MLNAAWNNLQPQSLTLHSGMVFTLELESPRRISANSPKSGEASVVVMLWMCSHMPFHNCQRCSNTLCMTWMWNVVWKVLQSQPLHRCTVFTLESPRISAKSLIDGQTSMGVTLWVCSHMSIPTTAEGAQTTYIYVWHGCGMLFERFYCLNHCVVAWFLHWNHLEYQPTLPNMRKPLWW
jgi:hypothetical protein